MGIDYGDARVGIALTDPLQIIASPFRVIQNSDTLIAELLEIINEYQIGEIAVGWPLNSKNEMTEQTRKVEQFIQKFEAEVDIPVVKVDESFTSKEAKQIMLSSSRKKKRKRQTGKTDQIAASLILSHYLEIRNNG